MKKILFFSFFFIFLFINQVNAEEIIRYAEEYTVTIGEINSLPNTEELKHWFSIDLPLNENNENIYTVEFNTKNVDLTKVGIYDIPMIFYKTVDKKYEKILKLNVMESINDNSKQQIINKYIEELLKIITSISAGIIILTTLLDGSNKTKIAIIKNNKFIKIISVKTQSDYQSKINKILRKLKINKTNGVLLINRQDLTNLQKKQIKTKRKYDSVLFVY